MKQSLILYCRPGFEADCGTELQYHAQRMQVYGYLKIRKHSGIVQFVCNEPEQADLLAKKLPLEKLTFTRQWFVLTAELSELPPDDRLSAVMAHIDALPLGGELRLEYPDTNEGKTLSRLCRKFTVVLRAALKQSGKLTAKPSANRPVIHLCFLDGHQALLGYSYSYNNSPWHNGILRLKFPKAAPSRSTLKLEEAFHYFVPRDEWDKRLCSGLNAVDLGASPGGWTWQLVQRGMMVQAVGKGEMDRALMETGQVKHLRQDGFKFRPKKHNVHWLVCDMIEDPYRVANLMLEWVLDRWCEEAIFNLKLPTARRFSVLQDILGQMEAALEEAQIRYQLRAKHLYHDREEVTVHLRRC